MPDRRVPQARQILRKLLPGKSLMFEAKDGYCEFWAEASVEKLLESVLPRTVASPAVPSWNRLLPWLRQMEILKKSAMMSAVA